jgi:hypothetical protein
VPIPSASKIIVSKVIDTKRCSPKVMAESGILAGVMFGKSKEEWVRNIQEKSGNSTDLTCDYAPDIP